MRPIGEVIKPLKDAIEGSPTRPTSSAEGRERHEDGAGGNGGDGSGRGGGRGNGNADRGDGEPELPGRRGGDGRRDCPRCHGVGWLRADVPIDHIDFGKALPCQCIQGELAERRLASARNASNMGALSRMTFEGFRVDAPGNAPESLASIRSAFDAAKAFAEAPDGWLFLHGNFGCGKTHLAAAIVNARLAQGESALFVVVPDLLDHLRASFAQGSDEGYDARFEAVRNAPLLVLDDLGTEAPTAWAGEKLFQIINHRYNARMPTVFTTNHDLEDLDERLRSRLGELGFVRSCGIHALDYRGGLRSDGTELSSLHLYDGAHFQTWDPRTGELEADRAENLARAFHLAREFAADPNGWLVFIGGHGCGKTHLAAAVANQRISQGGSALFVMVPDLLDHLRATFSPNSRVRYDKRFDEVRSCPLLVLDDLGTESATPWAQEKLYQILNHRHAASLPTIITLATPAKDPLAQVHPRLRSRMLDRRRCTVFEIMAPAYHGPVARPSRGKSRR